MVDKLRKGLHLKGKSKLVDNLVGKNLVEEMKQKELEKGKGKGTNKGSVRSVKQPISPVKSRIPSNRPLTVKPVNTPTIMGNANEDFHSLVQAAMKGNSGLKMSNKLKNKIVRG
jgi:hypothetical protein